MTEDTLTDGDVRRICRGVPGKLRRQHAKTILDQFCTAGIKEVACPVCDGGGMFPAGGITACPLCHAFRNVPRILAEWFERAVDERRSAASADRLSVGATQPSAIVRAPRYGAISERAIHVGEEVSGC